MDLNNLSKLQTEGINPRTVTIDQMSTLEMVTVINGDDQRVAESVVPYLPVIADAIDALTVRVRQGGRVIYVGAGTSGRLGVLDASEIPPTFAAPRSQFIGLIAGGDEAIRQAQEGAEDNAQAGKEDLTRLDLDPELDSIIGIASSGRTPYVLGCLAFAKELGCLTIGVACVSPSAMEISGNVDYLISPVSGPEVVTGSTRLKAGTVTKMVLNMLSTGTMIRAGKTYGNMMVDLVASNLKLQQRSRNILRRLSVKCKDMSDSELDGLLVKCGGSVKRAILVAETSESVETCDGLLASAGGVLSKALAASSQPVQTPTSENRQFVLCIDGGGTKCAAVIADESGILSHGSSGPCNLTDSAGNIDEVITTLIQATRDALENHPSNTHGLSPTTSQDILASSFRSVWIGLAGMDRSGLQTTLSSKLSTLFGFNKPSPSFKLTNDVTLLTALSSAESTKPSTLALIAGTGSVAMRHNWISDQYTCVARAGGWGHLLGDEGGGYSIGLEAVRHTLNTLEQRKLGITSRLSVFDEAILGKLGCALDDGDIDLLSDILSRHGIQSIKARVAGLAETVLKLEGDISEGIVERQVGFLVKILWRLTDPQSIGYVAPAETELVLAGGLMRNERYQKILRGKLDQQGLRFREIHVVEDVAVMVARYLLKRAD